MQQLVLAPGESAPLQLGFNACRRDLQPVTLRGHSDDARQPQQAIPLIGTPYHARIFDPISGLVANVHGTTAPAGRAIRLTSPRFATSTAPDSDGDFLPDDIDMAMGTDPHNPVPTRRKLPNFEWLQRENRGRTH